MKSIAIVSIIILTIINVIDVKSGARFQNWFTFRKIASISIVILLGFFLDGGSTQNLSPFFSEQSFSSLIGPLGLAMVAVLWTFDGWIFITYVAGEVKNPGRNIPLSIIYCMIIIVSVYLALNYVLVFALGFDKMIGSELVMSDAASIFLGSQGGVIITVIILISLIGANNGFILTSARINYAMAKNKLFFKQAASIHPKYKSPSNALIIQCVWACILTFTGTFNQLITYIIFASWIFYGMSAGAVIILRFKNCGFANHIAHVHIDLNYTKTFFFEKYSVNLPAPLPISNTSLPLILSILPKNISDKYCFEMSKLFLLSICTSL